MAPSTLTDSHIHGNDKLNKLLRQLGWGVGGGGAYWGKSYTERESDKQDVFLLL